MKEVKESVINLLGILSFGFAFVAPIAGLVLSIISLIKIKKEKAESYELARKLSIAAIIISILMILIQAAAVIYTMVTTGGLLQTQF